MTHTKEQRELIKTFIGTPGMADAVKRVLLESIYEQGGIKSPDKNWVFDINEMLPDDIYARQVQTMTNALKIVDAAFLNLVLVARSNPQAPPKNEAR